MRELVRKQWRGLCVRAGAQLRGCAGLSGAQTNEATQQWRDEPTGAGLLRVSLQDQEDQEGRLGPRAARGGEGGTHRGERESTVCGDVSDERAMGGAGFAREAGYCSAWRHGRTASKSSSILVSPIGRAPRRCGPTRCGCIYRPWPGDLGWRIAAAGPARDSTGRSAGSNDPDRALLRKTWCADPGDGAKGLGIDGLQLSVAGSLPAGVVERCATETGPASTSSNTLRLKPRQRRCGAAPEIRFRNERKNLFGRFVPLPEAQSTHQSRYSSNARLTMPCGKLTLARRLAPPRTGL